MSGGAGARRSPGQGARRAGGWGAGWQVATKRPRARAPRSARTRLHQPAFLVHPHLFPHPPATCLCAAAEAAIAAQPDLLINRICLHLQRLLGCRGLEGVLPAVNKVYAEHAGACSPG